LIRSNYRRTRIQCSACNIVELRPPQKVPPSNPILEDEPNHEPRRVIDAGGWGNKPDAVQDDWGADVFDLGLGMPSLPQPEGEWQEGTDDDGI